MHRNALLVLLFWLFGAMTALAEVRTALVIGNGAYATVNSLPNPSRDAAMMAETLGKLGFDVTLVEDGSYAEMRSAISGFGAKLRKGGKDGVGLFYYAGHGVQSFGRNYLLPVDIALTDAADLGLVAVEADSVLQQMRSAGNATNIVILDACRNNPYKALPDLDENGLAEMNAPPGTFLAYATGPGQTAFDGADGNSPFTAALLQELPKPGLTLEEVFKGVRRKVIEATASLQTPWDTSSLSSDFYFVPAKVLTPDEQAEAQMWEAVVAANDPMQVSLFLKAYPQSPHAPEARALLKALLEALVSPEPAPEVNGQMPAAPTDAEMSAFEQARVAGTREAYEAFIAAYPNSVMVEAANQELKALPKAEQKGSAADSPVKGIILSEPTPDNPADQEVDDAAYDKASIAFDQPLVLGGPGLTGWTLEQVISQGSPLYPPFKELPEEAWKGQKCTACHQWKRDILCDQAKVLLGQSGETAERSLSLPHPLGRPFKLTLRAWARDGCR